MKDILQEAINEWPEDEAFSLYMDLIQSVPGEESPMPGQEERAIEHMLKVFSFEPDSKELKARFLGKLELLTR